MKKLICLVEHDQKLATLIEKRLSAEGFETYHFISGEDYLEQHESGLPALYMVELNLPGMNGKELVKRIRLTSSIVPIHILSPEADSESIVEALRAGADDFLMKPFDMNEFITRVNVAWDKFSLMLHRKTNRSVDTSQ